MIPSDPQSPALAQLGMSISTLLRSCRTAVSRVSAVKPDAERSCAMYEVVNAAATDRIETGYSAVAAKPAELSAAQTYGERPYKFHIVRFGNSLFSPNSAVIAAGSSFTIPYAAAGSRPTPKKTEIATSAASPPSMMALLRTVLRNHRSMSCFSAVKAGEAAVMASPPADRDHLRVGPRRSSRRPGSGLRPRRG